MSLAGTVGLILLLALEPSVCSRLSLSIPGEARAAAGTTQLLPFLAGLSDPVYVTNAGDGSARLFVVERGGIIKVVRPDATTPTVFLDISDRVVAAGEQGLLGLAFHPQFSTNRRFFVNYTRASDGATVIARYKASRIDANVAKPTETIFLVIRQPYANHNGGMLAFGPDGYLYVGVGDGGSADDPGNRAQNARKLLGKILRIDVDHPDGDNLYSSPPTNPFFGSMTGRAEVFALGLRNPWRFSFDRTTGDLIAGDVGQHQREEIDLVTLGGNYGWRIWEGSLCTGIDPSKCITDGFVFPVAEYAHTGGRCAVTGGYVYRGARSSLPDGAYVFGDFCSGEIFLLQGGSITRLLDTDLLVASFGEDEAGEIYVVGLGGTVHRIVAVAPLETP